MDTSGLDRFAQDLRQILISGVKNRLGYWGFKEDGDFHTQPTEVDGGYTFRGQVFDDESVPKKWTRLKNAIRRHDYQYVAEEAAYTWFNRLMATRILEKNDHIQPVLEYTGDLNEPAILTRAKEGVIDVGDEEIEDSVRQAILDNDEDEALRTLLTDFCNRNEVLRGVFGDVSKYTEILLPTGLLRSGNVIDKLVGEDPISDDQYAQVELIGWLYQFYISEKKDAVYDKSGKFEPEDIPAATQIFTPNWIVRYLVENTIGKQWLQAEPDSPLRDDMEYLVQGDTQAAPGSNGASSPQGGTAAVEASDAPATVDFQNLQSLQLFDPAAGSGHILVEGFELLMAMYRERGYTDRQSVAHILTDNLKGLDIDRRAAQLARFALLMKAAEYDPRVLRRDVRPQVYPMPEPRSFSDADLRTYFDDAVFEAHGETLHEALALLAEHGQNAGSALQLELSDDVRSAIAREVAHWGNKSDGEANLTEQALVHELNAYLKPILLMTGTYPAVAANPPYASSRNINKPLKNYLKEHYPRAKRDLFATFMEVLPDHTVPGGRFAFITPPSWMFLSSYEDLRTQYIDDYFFDSLLHLSRGIFGADFGSVATAVQKAGQQGRTGTYFRLIERTFQEFHARHLHDLFRRVMDDPDFRYDFSTYDKDGSIPETSVSDGQQLYYPDIDQRDFEKIPGVPIAYWVPSELVDTFEEEALLNEICPVKQGMTTGDTKKFIRCWYEIGFENLTLGARSLAVFEASGSRWVPYNKGGGYRKWFGNNEYVVGYDKKSRLEMNKKPGHRHDGKFHFFRSGVTWSKVSSGNFGARVFPKGFLFDVGGPALFPNSDQTKYITSFLNSVVTLESLKALNPTLNFKVGDLRCLPLSNGGGTKARDTIDDKSGSCVRVARRDWDSRETSWNFTQHPFIQQNAPSLEAAYTAWQGQATDDFLQLHANEEELNDLFIELYGLEDELSPRVALDDITILDDELDWDAVEALDAERDSLSDDELRARLLEDDPDEALFKMEVPIRQLLSYGIGVMLGRYRLAHDGLHIAHPEPSADELAPYEVPTPLCGSEPEGTTPLEIDDDAIVPLMGRDSPFNDSAVHRMQKIVRLVWGEETLTENLNFINHALSVGRSRGLKRDYEKTMEEWLVEDFWDWHKSLYSVPYYGKKPIYWLFQSPEGHFQVLVYMHRMDKYTPQRVRQDYLRRYREYIVSEIDKLESVEELDGDDEKRLDELRDKKADCREYSDILKEVAEKQIEIDLDEGVQNNYPKFGEALADL